MMKKIFRLLALLVFVAGMVNPLVSVSSRADEGVRLVCLNIGKADCMLLLSENQAYLIDTGYEHTYAALQTMLAQYGVSRLNGVILTHCHEDHEGGLMPLAQSDLPVDAWYAARIYYDVKEEKHPAKKAAAIRGMSVQWLDAGDQIPVGQQGKLTVLGPRSVNSENENNNSLVLRFSSPHGSVLLAGDMKEEEEMELLRAGVLAPCDLLKVGHHGDNKATTMDFLRAIQPKAAVILTSTLEETDTPARSTLNRLSSVGCQTYVSQDMQDAVMMTLQDGKIGVYDVSWGDVPGKLQHIHLAIDMKQDLLTIQNAGDQAVLMAGYSVYSSKGNDVLALPDISLQAGECFTIGSRKTEIQHDWQWDKKRIWHEKDRDVAILYDAYGRIVAGTDNGISE